MADVTGLDQIEANLEKYRVAVGRALYDAGDEIGRLLANYAKVHHGTHPRKAAWVYPGGGRQVKVKNMYFKGTGAIGPGSYFRRTRRWREGGTGWGDVTSATQQSTVGGVSQVTSEFVMVALTAGMDYDVLLEKAREGRWAWLWPAVIANENEMKSILARHLGGVSI